MDVVTAFLNPDIDVETYMSLPDDMGNIRDEHGRPIAGKTIVKLLKALYGLRQSPRLWHQLINGFLLSLGLTPSPSDPNLYIGNGVLLLLYVDDILLVDTRSPTEKSETKAPSKAEETKQALQERFKMTYLGPAKRFLGLEIAKTPTGIHLSQSEYIKAMLVRYKFETISPVGNPPRGAALGRDLDLLTGIPRATSHSTGYIGESLLEVHLLHIQNSLLAIWNVLGEKIVEVVVDARIPDTTAEAEGAEDRERQDIVAQSPEETLLAGRTNRLHLEHRLDVLKLLQVLLDLLLQPSFFSTRDRPRRRVGARYHAYQTAWR